MKFELYVEKTTAICVLNYGDMCTKLRHYVEKNTALCGN